MTAPKLLTDIAYKEKRRLTKRDAETAHNLLVQWGEMERKVARLEALRVAMRAVVS